MPQPTVPLDSDSEIDRLLSEVMMPPCSEDDIPDSTDELTQIHAFIDSSQRYAKHSVEEVKEGSEIISSADIFKQMDLKKQEINKKKKIEEEIKAK